MNRRGFLRTTGALALGALPRARAAQGSPRVSAADAFDRAMHDYMTPRGIPGGSLAVSRQGRLVYARGYGWADRDSRSPVRPDSLFRIASVSKPFTAVAVLKLVDEGRLRLEDRVFDLLPSDAPLPGAGNADPRLSRITLRQLLQHTGGWDREAAYDPMFHSAEICRRLGTPGPAGPREIIRYMRSEPLQFDPGSRHAYSNFGYCLLGRVIERVTGRPYEAHVRERVLEPLGIRSMRVGRTQPALRASREVRYYTPHGETGPSVFPGAGAEVPLPYGAFHLEAMDAHGGWIASATDLVRFAASLDFPGRRRFLTEESLRTMAAPPPAPVFRDAEGALGDYWYGCGWMVRKPRGQSAPNFWHNGRLPGTWSILVRRWDGMAWAALFNLVSEGAPAPGLPDNAVDPALHRAADAVTDWPSGRALMPG
jgi:N-acyl-D-amino-acid deacylase